MLIININLAAKKNIEFLRCVIFLSSVKPVFINRFYCATKFALRALAEGWRQELKELQSNIRISSIFPGTKLQSSAAEPINKKSVDPDSTLPKSGSNSSKSSLMQPT